MGCDLTGSPVFFRNLVSIHAPAWGATHPYMECCHVQQRFNPRTRVGCDAWPRRPWLSGVASFNPRTRVGCDEESSERKSAQKPVSIHAPAWGATPAPRGHPRSRRFQSTHPRGVRRWWSSWSFLPFVVSIHAPAWGATAAGIAQGRLRAEFQSTHPRGVRHGTPIAGRNDIRVSIHAPAWGATAHSHHSHLSLQFQSTHPRGVRPELGSVDINQLRVSIHAPAWGATSNLTPCRQ